MTFLNAALLGVVEGITEFLPISSTGHLILASQLLGVSQSEFLKTFEIFIQLGAILAVVVLFWRKFLDIEVLKRIVYAFIPTGIVGIALYGVVKTYWLENDAIVLGALFLGGVALIVFEYSHVEHDEALADIKALSWHKAVTIGFFQSLAIVPGVSRSAATIVGGLALGLKRATIVEFSFLLAVPTMLAASGLDLAKHASHFTFRETVLLGVGFFVAFIVAHISIKWLLRYVRSNTFVPFGIYRILIALVFFFLIFH